MTSLKLFVGLACVAVVALAENVTNEKATTTTPLLDTTAAFGGAESLETTFEDLAAKDAIVQDGDIDSIEAANSAYRGYYTPWYGGPFRGYYPGGFGGYYPGVFGGFGGFRRPIGGYGGFYRRRPYGNH